jgi:hypothetical protein
MESARATRLRRILLYYGAHVAVTVVLLAGMQHFRRAPLRVPWGWSYWGDGLFFTAFAKAVHEDGPWHASRIGAPFGSDIVDWPTGMWLPLGTIHVIAIAFPEPGTAINLYWMSTLVVAGVCAAYAFRRLRVGAGLSFVCGMLYAFLPYAWYRNVGHINLAYPLVPLLCLLCLRVAGARPEDQSRSERFVLWTACVLQGLSYVYYSFFACLLLVPAMLLGVGRLRRAAPIRTGVVAIFILSATTAITLVPSLLYSRAHGKNAEMDYKSAAEADTYGLKLRHLLTPVPEHPLAPFAAAAAAVEGARFPGDNENITARLGTMGSFGLIALLVFVVGRVAGVWTGRDDDLDAAAALTLVALLVSQVGGLGSLFNVFIAAEIRAYNRISVFIAFFCLLAAAVVMARAAARWGLDRRIPPALGCAGLGVLMIAGLRDQLPYRLADSTPASLIADFEQDRAFVAAIEGQLPAEAMIFQLPHDNIPFAPYEPARPYLHSHRLRWSWGAMAGRSNAWQDMVYRLPPVETARWATLAGFAGLWVDRWYYQGRKKDWPRYESIEGALAALPVGPPQVSPNGRYSFFPLARYARQIQASVGAAAYARLGQETLQTLPVFRWMDGCSPEWVETDGWWRSCQAAAHLLLRNPQRNPLRVAVVGRFRSGNGVARRLVVSLGDTKEALAIGAEPVTWRHDVDLPGGTKAPLDLAVEGGPPCDAETTPCIRAQLTARPFSSAVRPPAGAPPDEPPPASSPL